MPVELRADANTAEFSDLCPSKPASMIENITRDARRGLNRLAEERRLCR
jgi:hypothetical protein